MRFIPALFLFVALSACVQAVTHRHPDGITVWYDPIVKSLDDARADAEAHCLSYGKEARYLGKDRAKEWPAWNAHFACVAPETVSPSDP